MILPMIKYSFIIFHKDYDQFLGKLGELGVLDVIEREDVNKEEELSEDTREMGRIDGVLKMLEKGDRPAAAGVQTANPDQQAVLAYLEEAEALEEQQKRLETLLEENAKETERLKPWGDFSSSDLERLKPAGYEVRLFKCNANRFDPEWENQYYLFHISKTESTIHFLVIRKIGEETAIDAEPVDPGTASLSGLQTEKQQLDEEMVQLRDKLVSLGDNAVPVLREYRLQLSNRMKLSEVYLDTQKISDNRLMVLEGWVPEDSTGKLDSVLENEAVVSLANPPMHDDSPPVKLKNSRFSRLFEPISKLFDLPSYGELDLTPYFAPFFMIFFGFCLGDAGYGVFFILFGSLLKLKAKKELRPLLSLAQVFGIATIVFGLLSGTFFGINLIDSGYTITESSIASYSNQSIPANDVSALQEFEGQYFKSREEFLDATSQAIGTASVEKYQTELIRYAEAGIPFVSSFRHLMQDPLQMFYLSILIGGVQILFGIFVKVLNITRRRGFRYALSTVGWLILIISVILNSLGLFDGVYTGYLFYGLLAISGVFILILNKPGAGILNRIGSGIWDSYGMVTGFFGDILSYIRLFALGISSAILGFVFNDISLQLLDIPYIGWFFFLVLLLFGHTINLFMATLGGFIHPMRLTFVEFYKNAGFEGGGRKYNPFIINNSNLKESK